ncbi:nuclear transport factor 2 family protein [Phytohabitans kaempferiae]|uniref:Nuclear transport factor 2 family protein n=1 Tax=Phytohabitans kaempferiae TaxID=1620943 RepID=A0ABV6M1X7_9ACTN
MRETSFAVGGDAELIAAGIADMYDAFLAGDRDRFDSHLHPEVTTWETHLPGPLRTRAELDAYRETRDAVGQRPRLDRLDATDLRVDVWNDTAAARYVLVAVPAGAGNAEQSRVTDVLRRDGDRWVIVHHHAERVPLAAPSGPAGTPAGPRTRPGGPAEVP